MLSLSAGTALLSCAKVEIKDAEFCGDMGDDGAVCYHTLTTESREIDKVNWDVERFGQICTSAQTFAEWKATIEKLCSASKRCTYEEQQMIEQFYRNMDRVLDKASNK